MTIFAQTLSRLMAQRALTPYQLERIGSLKRTTITKYMGGSSKPPDADALDELIRMMALGIEETEELRTAYYITKIGESIYFRRKHVEELLKNMNSTSAMYPFELRRSSTLNLKRDVECISGKFSISNVLGTVISMEAFEEKPELWIIAQPEGNPELMSYLKTAAGAEPSLKIKHIVCADNKSASTDNGYNINIMKELMPLIVSGAAYVPYYYYDSVGSHINQFSGFPNVVITSRYVMCISYDFDRAYISGFGDFLEMHRNMFSAMMKKCDAYVQPLPGPLDILSYYDKMIGGADSIIPDFSVMPDPCLIPFLDEDMIRNYAKLDLPNIEAAVELLIKRVRRFRRAMGKKPETSFCTKHGFKKFMETGIITEIPIAYYNPFGMDERRIMIERMYEAMKNGVYRLKIMDDRFDMQNISFACYKEYSMTYSYNHPSKGMLAFGFRERSTVTSIYDYFVSLEEQNLILNQEETEQFVLEMLGKPTDFAQK